MSRRTAAPLDDLDALVAEIVVDAYGDDEPQVAFLEVFNQEVRLPAADKHCDSVEGMTLIGGNTF